MGPEAERHIADAITAANHANDNVGAYEGSEADRALLMARTAANKYMSSHSEESATEVELEKAAIESSLATFMARGSSAERHQDDAQAPEQVSQFFAAFKKIHDLVLARDDIVNNSLNRIGPKAGTDAENLKLALKAEQDKLGLMASKTTHSSVILNMAVSLIAIGAAVIAAIIIGRGISRPVAAMTSVMNRLAGHDMTATVEAFAGRSDEIGLMAGTVQTFRDNIIKADKLSAEQELQREAQAARTRRVEELTKNFEAGVSNVLEAVARAAASLTDTSSTMSAAAHQAATQAAAVAVAAEQASTNVQTVSSSTEELSASVREITHQTSETKSVTDAARTESQKANAQVNTLAEAAHRIGEVVNLINSIASQTKLLALNATIEAARAGDAGRGFAVVANEVKELASQTAKATDEITQQITGVQTSTRDAVGAIGGITETIGKVYELSVSTAASVEEQEAATREITRNLHEAAQGTREVTTNIAGVTAAAEQTGVAATLVHDAANNLNGQAQMLRDLITEFLTEVKAA